VCLCVCVCVCVCVSVHMHASTCPTTRENFTKDASQTPEQAKALVTSVYTMLSKVNNTPKNKTLNP